MEWKIALAEKLKRWSMKRGLESYQLKQEKYRFKFHPSEIWSVEDPNCTAKIVALNEAVREDESDLEHRNPHKSETSAKFSNFISLVGVDEADYRKKV